MTDRAGRSAGFTLIETLVALVILAIAAGYAFRTVSGSFDWLSRADLEQQGISSAETALGRLGHDVAVRPGRLTGSDGSLNWRIEIGDALADPPPAEGLAAYPVTITVAWTERGAVRTIQLQSARLGPAESPP